MKSIAERVWSKVRMGAHDECWPWTGAFSRGKPTLSIKPTTISPRKLVWELTHGVRPDDGRHVEVTCGNTHCLNPAHLICPTTSDRFWQHVERGPGCWIWKGALAKGIYGCFGFRVQGRKYTNAAHRYAYELANGPIVGHVPGHPELEVCVCHRCDNVRCVRPDHLFLGTDQDNHDDMVAKGRHARGPALSEAIRRANEARRNMQTLAEKAMGIGHE